MARLLLSSATAQPWHKHDLMASVDASRSFENFLLLSARNPCRSFSSMRPRVHTFVLVAPMTPGELTLAGPLAGDAVGPTDFLPVRKPSMARTKRRNQLQPVYPHCLLT